MVPTTRSAAKREPTAELLAMIAGRFRALGEPARLGILHALEGGPLTVTELVQRTGLGQGNLSKHLQLLLASGFVTRRRRGLFAYYALADERVLALCALMCDRLEDDLHSARQLVSGER